MSRVDELPPDRRAVLQLLLKQGRSYDQIATMLKIEARAVRHRALGGLDELVPEAPADLSPARQDEVGDWLLGQGSDAELGATRSFLESSPAGRAWATEVSAALNEIGGHPLPVVPSGAPDTPAEDDVEPVEPAAPLEPVEHAARAEPAPPVSAPDPEPPATPAPEPTPTPTPTPDAVPDVAPAPAGQADAPPSAAPGPKPALGDDEGLPVSRRGGLVVLGGLAAIIVLAVLLFARRDNTDETPLATTPATASTPAATTADGGTAETQVNLISDKSDAIAVALVINRGGQRILGISGQKFPPTGTSFSYAVWLYNSQTDATRLGFVSNAVQSDGKLLTGADPTQAGTTAEDKAAAATLTDQLARFYDYKQVVITKETAANSTQPGPIVVAGPIRRPAG